MSTLNEFLNMGGYGAFVWPSYGVSALILICLIVLSIRHLRKIERELKPLETDRKSRRRRKVPTGDTVQ
ncbi:MAG: heme exporter protein CcmD [Sneathiella sp.]|nr:heme exporter protein CcmD [Sneathiella sp.]